MAQQMPLPLTISCSSKSRLVLPSWFLPFWCLLTQMVPDKFQKNSKTIVSVCACTSSGQQKILSNPSPRNLCFISIGLFQCCRLTWQEGHPAYKKTEWWDAGMVMCLSQGADLHMAWLMHCHSLSLAPVNPDWFYLPGFTFVVLAHPGSPGHNPRGP